MIKLLRLIFGIFLTLLSLAGLTGVGIMIYAVIRIIGV